MPKEIVSDMGIQFVSLPEEQEREKDAQLLAVLVKMLDESHLKELTTIFGRDYVEQKLRKAEKAIVKSQNKGKTINISRNPGMTPMAIETS